MKVVRLKTISTLLVLLTLILSGTVSAFQPSKDDRTSPESLKGHAGAADMIIAKVNGVGINLETLNRKMWQIKMKKYGSKETTSSLAKQIREEAFERLIIEELAFQRSKPLAGTITPEEVKEHWGKTEKYFGGKERFAEYLQREGLTEEDMLKEMERYLTVQKALEKEVYSKVVVTEQNIKDLYEISKENFVQKEMVQITDIVFFLDPKSPESFSKAELLLNKLKTELKNDPDQLISDGTFYVDQDIKINQIKHPEVYQVAKELKEHELSEVFIADETLHIIKLTGYQPRIEKSMEEVLPELENSVKNKIRKQLMEEWMADLKNNADIEIIDLTVE